LLEEERNTKFNKKENRLIPKKKSEKIRKAFYREKQAVG